MSDRKKGPKSAYSLSHSMDRATLSILLQHLPAFLPPEDVTDIISQLQERFPASLCDEMENNTSTAIAAQLDAVQEIYPLRAAALYLRVLLNMLAILFEQKGFTAVSDDVLRLSIDGLLRAETVIERHCLHCPKTMNT